MTQAIRDWNPAEGDLFQGDVMLFRLPEGLAPDRTDRVQPRDGRLILAKGEATGHHHAIWMNSPMFHDDALARALAPDLSGDREASSGGRAETPTAPARAEGVAALYRDEKLARALEYRGRKNPDFERTGHFREIGLVTASWLCVGFLVVEGDPVLLRHQEHDTVRVPPGVYYVGGQREFHAGSAYRVSD